ncbi:MAG: F0F1 ATP synthase subunit B [Candidatus Nanopelagicales bacterium]
MYPQIASEVNVLSIPLDELIIGIVSFLIVFGGLSWLALPGIRKALVERTAAIEGGIAKSEAAQAEANALKEQYQARLAEARTEAAAIRAQAQADKSAILEEARREAADVAAAVTSRAEAHIAAERASTVTSLRREVGELAVTLAGKVVGETLTDDDRVRATIDRFLDDLEAKAASGEAAR